jgi:hypothetical protein
VGGVGRGFRRRELELDWEVGVAERGRGRYHTKGIRTAMAN